MPCGHRSCSGSLGFAAQLVDGSLGMAYGVTSTTPLLAIGTNAAAASATVHLAEIGTTLASGVAHWRFNNIDLEGRREDRHPGRRRRVRGRDLPVEPLDRGRRAGHVADPAHARPHILIRFTAFGLPKGNLGKPMRKRFLAPLGLLAGFVDATGGGGWGPVGTPAILAGGRMEPRKVIGSIDASEFLVAIAASLGFLVGIGSENIDFAWVGVLLLGGVSAAPIAAWLVRHVPPRILGSAVGGLIIITNVHSAARRLDRRLQRDPDRRVRHPRARPGSVDRPTRSASTARPRPPRPS